jgi:ribose transport system permease protein
MTNPGNRGAATLTTAQARPRRLSFGGGRKELGIFVLLLVLCIFTGVRNPNFFGAANLQDLARLVGIYGIFSIGMGVVIITGGIDLSVGSVFALEGVLGAMMLTEWHWPPALAVLGCLALTMGIGVFQGLLITRVNLQPFIVTLCGLLFYRGLARFLSGDSTEGFGDAAGFRTLEKLCAGKVCPVHGHLYLRAASDAPGLPMAFLLMVLIGIVMWVVLHHSIYGRYLYAVGRNEEAARYSGIDSRAVIASAYVVSGALAGVAGLLLAFYTNSISPSSFGQSYELYGIAAAVLGGCSLRGGEGSIVGILIGTALLQVLQNLVNLLGIPSSLDYSVVGAVILLGVITDELVKRRTARKVRSLA